jgi:excisionase family DNA binding protein
MNNMLTIEEVKSFLDVDQTELEKHLKAGKLHAYKIGGTYLRFRKEEVLNLRSELMPKKPAGSSVSMGSRLGDFWRFNNFYIVSLVIVVAIVVLISKT